MITITERQKIESLSQELSEKGYRVITQPTTQDLPFSLGSYIPDIVAFNNEGGLILEVKSHSTKVSADRLQEVSEMIASHQNWRFLLITLNDALEIGLPSENEDLPSWEMVKQKLQSIEVLLQSSMLEPALIYLWGLIEVVLRKRAIVQYLPIERFSMKQLLKHMYSSGEISIDELDLIESLLEKRNRVAHGLIVSLGKKDIEKLFQATHSLVNQWS